MSLALTYRLWTQQGASAPEALASVPVLEGAPPKLRNSPQDKDASTKQEEEEDPIVNPNEPEVEPEKSDDAAGATKGVRANEALDNCQFRKYPPHRYYKLQEPEPPAFLTQTDYIFGEYPILLPVGNGEHEASKPSKMCVNQSEWLDPDTTNERLPFADGTNPSILRVDRLKDIKHLKEDQGVHYVATLCMTNSQCQWKETDHQKEEFRVSDLTGPNTVRTILLLMDKHLQIQHEASIYLELNAKWGKRVKPKPLENGSFDTELRDFDDARLFYAEDETLWISFREGKQFGWDKQVLNPVHVTFDEENKSLVDVRVKASESKVLCCGRNMALMVSSSSTKKLQSLTWVDPVTVVNVDNEHNKRRRLSSMVNGDIEHLLHRRLAGKNQPKKSHIHGTNAFMVPFKGKDGVDEYIGMAHFHRPNDRNPNDYARHGHHYTHAFFTIKAGTEGKEEPSYQLSRIGPEFLLPSYHDSDDGEVIQFISGLEIDDDMVILAYGINDCEGGVVSVGVEQVEDMLRHITPGQQVVDMMAPWNNERKN